MLLRDLGRVFLLVRVLSLLLFRILLKKIGVRPCRLPSVSEMVRVALERLGVTYLKLGQYLATRFDLLPQELYKELTKLFENASAVRPDQIRAVIEEELGAPLETIFVYFEWNPIASASIAQVHRARTVSGSQVAVKVQRPGIEAVFAADLRNLVRFARLVDFLRLLGTLSLVEVVDQFGTWSERELNFLLEARTAIRMAENATPNEVVPKVFTDLTTSKVLTLEFVEGVSLAKIAELLDRGRSDLVHERLPNLDFERSGRNLAFAALHQLFGTGIFHGDPHPGNILIRDDNRIAFVDFGIFGELTDYERKALAGYVENISFGNIPECFRFFERLTFPTAQTDRKTFAAEAQSVFQRWYEATQDPQAGAHERHMGKYTAEVFDVVRRNHVRMNMDTLLFWRTLNVLDSSAVRLSEHFDLIAQMRSFFDENRPSLTKKLFEELAKHLRSPEILRVVLDLPKTVDADLGVLRRGESPIDFGVETRQLRRELNSETKRIASAVLLGSVLLVATRHALPGIVVVVAALLLTRSALKS